MYAGEATWLSDCHPGPGPEECKHLRWATGVFRGRPTSLLERFASRALKAIKLALPLGGRCFVRSGASGP